MLLKKQLEDAIAAASSKEPSTSPPVNWSRWVEQVQKDYETPPAKGTVHGLQKDAVQNGWGARPKGHHPWKYKFHLITKSVDLPLFTMTDVGTVGLTGKTDFNIGALHDKEDIPSDERWTRFRAVFESGGGQSGPGLFGRGKTLFNAVSKRMQIYYDTLTKDNDYRFSMHKVDGRDFKIGKFFEGKEAREALKSTFKGALRPLIESGTRVIVVDPSDELIESVKSGKFLEAIEETWWEIILKQHAEITVQIDEQPSKTAGIPVAFNGLPEKAKDGWKVFLRENIEVKTQSESYRIKRIHLLVSPEGKDLPSDLAEVAIHRRGMTIGPMKLSGIPPTIENRLFGYVTLDEKLEDALAPLENTTHYGFSSPHKSPYKNIRQHVQDGLDVFLEQMGFRKSHDTNEKTKRLLEDAQEDLNSILRDLNVPGLGSGREKADDLLVSVEDLEFPEDSNYLTIGDRISGFHFLVKNTSAKTHSYYVEVYTSERDTGTIDTLQARQRIDLEPDKSFDTPPLSIVITKAQYPRFKKVACTCAVTDSEKKVIAKKSFTFFIDVEHEVITEYARIRLKSAEWPRDSKRVNYEESIR